MLSATQLQAHRVASAQNSGGLSGLNPVWYQVGCVFVHIVELLEAFGTTCRFGCIPIERFSSLYIVGASLIGSADNGGGFSTHTRHTTTHWRPGFAQVFCVFPHKFHYNWSVDLASVPDSVAGWGKSAFIGVKVHLQSSVDGAMKGYTVSCVRRRGSGDVYMACEWVAGIRSMWARHGLIVIYYCVCEAHWATLVWWNIWDKCGCLFS